MKVGSGHLHDHADRIVGKTELLAAFWGNGFDGDPSIVEVGGRGGSARRFLFDQRRPAR